LLSLEFIGKLWLDAAVSWSRLFLALLVSLIFSWAVGITAARSSTGEKIVLPLLDILQSVPILGFFPIILVVFIAFLPQQTGIYLAVTFLIFTSMTWNITFAVYEAIKSISKDFMQLAKLERMGLFQRITKLYIPASWPKVAYNTMVSWSVALFYLVASEIFSLGKASYQVTYGIGVDIAKYGAAQEWDQYAASMAVLILMVLITYFLFLNEFSQWTEKFKLGYDAPKRNRRNPVHRFYHWIDFLLVARVRSMSLGKLFERGISNSMAHLLLLARWTTSQDQSPGMRGLANSQRESQKGRAMRTIEYTLFALIAIAILSSLALSSSGGFARGYALFYSDMLKVIPSFLYSLARIWGVYVVTALVSVPLGIAIASNDRLFAILTPALQITAAIPAPALLPPIAIAVMSLPDGGGGEANAFFVIFLGMIWYLIFNIIEGVRSIPKQIFSVARLLDLKGWRYWRDVLLPAILPSFITGSITAIGGGWNTLIIAEYFAVTVSNGSTVALTQVPLGIGKLLDQAAASGDLLLLGLSVTVMVAFVFGFNVTVWRRLYRMATSRTILEGTR